MTISKMYGTAVKPEEVQEYYKEQAKDPYYRTIIEERGFFLNRKGNKR